MAKESSTQDGYLIPEYCRDRAKRVHAVLDFQEDEGSYLIAHIPKSHRLSWIEAMIAVSYKADRIITNMDALQRVVEEGLPDSDFHLAYRGIVDSLKRTSGHTSHIYDLLPEQFHALITYDLLEIARQTNLSNNANA